MPCEIEVDLSPSGLPKSTIVGLPDAAVKESAERVRTAILNSGYRYPTSRITINLAPADVRKEGPVYDLSIAVAILRAGGTVAPFSQDGLKLEEFLVAGELALDGRVRAVKGVLSLAMLARSLGKRGVIVPQDNAAEAAVVDGIDVFGVGTLGTLVGSINGEIDLQPHPTVDIASLISSVEPDIDFADVRGQEAAKRALTIAAAGSHNVLTSCPSVGTGESLISGLES